MPMPRKGAHLAVRSREGRESTFVIRDTGKIEIATGTLDRGEAEVRLADYIAGKNRSGGPAEPGDMILADVLTIYGNEHAPTVADPARIGYAIDALVPFWGRLTALAVKGETCRRYGKWRDRAAGTIRRELNVLQAALNYCAREGYLLGAPTVTLPDTPETNQRALERHEVARLIRAARARGQHHIARFILVSIYTGTRKVAVLNLRLSGPATTGGWFDLDTGILYRKGEGERSTKKRRTPARLPRQMLSRARRWHENGATWAVEWRGGRVRDIKTAWGKVVRAADLGWTPTPHTLKHTAITWAIRNGASVEDASSYFATSPETIIKTYWHLSPHHQQGALRAIERNGK